MYSRSAKGGGKGDPNRNPWLAKMGIWMMYQSGVICFPADLFYHYKYPNKVGFFLVQSGVSSRRNEACSSYHISGKLLT